MSNTQPICKGCGKEITQLEAVDCLCTGDGSCWLEWLEWAGKWTDGHPYYCITDGMLCAKPEAVNQWLQLQ